MVRIRDFDGKKYSAQAALFTGKERVHPDERRAENRLRSAPDEITVLLFEIEAIGKFPVALFVIFPVISVRIPIFVEDLRY